MNPQRKEAVENPNAIFSSINRTAECGRREPIIPARAGGSGHMQFYAQSCGLYFRRGAGEFKPAQKSMKRFGCQYLDSIEISLTVLLQLALLHRMIALNTQTLHGWCRHGAFHVYLTSLSFCGCLFRIMEIILSTQSGCKGS